MKNKRKKLMLLGGMHFLLPVIQAAHEQGYHVITCDYLPDNIAHHYSDEYCNTSILDKEAILEAARERQIDGIMSFAVDPGVVTAAYVQEQMGLPGNPYQAVVTLQNKNLFRQFLKDHGFTTPWFRSFTSINEALNARDLYPWPVIVKPVDAAGSKGVTKVDCFDQLEHAIRHAMSHSFSGTIVIEEFIASEGCPSGSDCFSVDGELKFVSFSAQRFDPQAPNPYAPCAHSWPSTMTEAQQKELRSELQRLISLLGMKTSIYNVETRVGKNNKTYIMEVSPRGGGNRIAEMLRYATGIDLITNAVRTAVGDPPINLEQKPSIGYWAEIILHSTETGIFSELDIAPHITKHVVETDLWVKKGDPVHAFNGANNAIGTLVLHFNDPHLFEQFSTHYNQWGKVILT